MNESLSAASAHISAAQAEALVLEHYGIRAQATVLTSERDHNFRITATDGREFAFKVGNPAESAAVNDFQLAAMQHIEAVAPALPVPRVQRTLSGESHHSLTFENSEVRSVRLISYLPGEVMNAVRRTKVLRQNLGRMLAEMGQALRDFTHPGAPHDLAWDLKNTSRAAGLLKHMDAGAQRDLAEGFLNDFLLHVAPVLPELRAQVVHNDLNLHNVLVDPAHPDTVVGILDFGDMVETALIVDAAVGASYHVWEPTDHGDPWDRVIDFVAAYHAQSPLTGQELDLLYDLIAARFVITVAITGWRAKRYPENAAYILKNNVRAWEGLRLLSVLPRETAQSRLRKSCNVE